MYDASKVINLTAFAWLEASGLVQSAIGEGVHVRPINHEILAEVDTFREAIEIQAIQKEWHHTRNREIVELRNLLVFDGFLWIYSDSLGKC